MGAGSGPLRRGVIVGAGAVGAMFAGHLRDSGMRICLVDTRTPPWSPTEAGYRWLTGDITHIDVAVGHELGEADLVLLAVPEPVAVAAVGHVAAFLRPGTVLADTLSVKSQIAAAAHTVPDTVEMVSLNPMFAPALGIAGRAVSAVVLHDGPGVRRLLDLVTDWGARVVRQSAIDHDRLTGATQVLTHAAVLAFGLALVELNVDLPALVEVAPPPHAAMLSLLARIASGVPEVYWDIQRANPQAQVARSALAQAIERLSTVVTDGDEKAFAMDIDQLSGLFAAQLAAHRENSDQMLAALHDVWRSRSRTAAPDHSSP